jgi:hypothetical protein
MEIGGLVRDTQRLIGKFRELKDSQACALHLVRI